MAPDWAAALAPVDDRVAAMGLFLARSSRPGATTCPPANTIFRAFERPLADVRVLVVGQDPYPTPGTRSGSPSPSTRTCGRSRRAWPTSTASCAPTSASTTPPHGDLTAWADQGVMLLNRVADRAHRQAQVPPRQGLGGDHPVRDRGARAARRTAASRSSGAATRRASSRCSARSRGSSRRTRRRSRRTAASSARARSARSTRCSPSRAARTSGLALPME